MCRRPADGVAELAIGLMQVGRHELHMRIGKIQRRATRLDEIASRVGTDRALDDSSALEQEHATHWGICLRIWSALVEEMIRVRRIGCVGVHRHRRTVGRRLPGSDRHADRSQIPDQWGHCGLLQVCGNALLCVGREPDQKQKQEDCRRKPLPDAKNSSHGVPWETRYGRLRPVRRNWQTGKGERRPERYPHPGMRSR